MNGAAPRRRPGVVRRAFRRRAPDAGGCVSLGEQRAEVERQLVAARVVVVGEGVAAVAVQAQAAVHPVGRWRVDLPPRAAGRERTGVAVRGRNVDAPFVRQERRAVYGPVAADAQIAVAELLTGPLR